MFSLKEWPQNLEAEIVFHVLDILSFDTSEYGTLRVLTGESVPTNEQMFNCRRQYLGDQDIFDV